MLGEQEVLLPEPAAGETAAGETGIRAATPALGAAVEDTGRSIRAGVAPAASSEHTFSHAPAVLVARPLVGRLRSLVGP